MKFLFTIIVTLAIGLSAFAGANPVQQSAWTTNTAGNLPSISGTGGNTLTASSASSGQLNINMGSGTLNGSTVSVGNLSGNGSGITGINAANVSGTFNGNGGGLTNLVAANVIGAVFDPTNAAVNAVKNMATNGVYYPTVTIGGNQLNAEPVPLISIGSFYINGNGPLQTLWTNALNIWVTNGILGPNRWANFIVCGGSSTPFWLTLTNRDANGNLVVNATNFPNGILWFNNWCRSNYIHPIAFLNIQPTLNWSNSYTYGYEFQDATNCIGALGFDGVDAEQTGAPLNGTNGEWVQPNFYSLQWEQTTNYQWYKKEATYFDAGFKYLTSMWSTNVNGIGDWTNSYASHCIHPAQPYLRLGSIIPYDFMGHAQNEWYVPCYGSQAIVNGSYSGLTNSINSQTILLSQEDSATNVFYLIHHGSYPTMGTLAINSADIMFLTNALEQRAMLGFNYDFAPLNSGAVQIFNLLTNPVINAVWQSQLLTHGTLVQNVPTGDAAGSVMQVWSRALENGKYAIWLWNLSTNTTVTTNLSISLLTGLNGDYTLNGADGSTATTSGGLLSVTVPAFNMRMWVLDETLRTILPGQLSFVPLTTNGVYTTILTNSIYYVTNYNNALPTALAVSNLPPGIYYFTVQASATTADTNGVQLTLTSNSGDRGSAWCERIPNHAGGFSGPQTAKLIWSNGGTTMMDGYNGQVQAQSVEAHGYISTTATNNYTVYYKCLTAGDTNQPQIEYNSYIQFIKVSYP